MGSTDGPVGSHLAVREGNGKVRAVPRTIGDQAGSLSTSSRTDAADASKAACSSVLSSISKMCTKARSLGRIYKLTQDSPSRNLVLTKLPCAAPAGESFTLTIPFGSAHTSGFSDRLRHQRVELSTNAIAGFFGC